jgi:uncharacterized protein (DUF1800 family)
MVTSSAVIAANRFGLGARPGELAAFGDDPRGALLRQLEGPGHGPEGGLASTAQILEQFFELRELRRTAKEGLTPAAAATDPAAKVRQTVVPHYLAQASAKIRLAATTRQSFRERLVSFWSNHFAVSVDKIACLGIAGSFENEAIRPHVTGRFIDLLVAAERHPAMILYLDNQASIGPNSVAAHRAQGVRQLGINENLAREILELHTLGVDGGYTQQDVGEFARVISGWSVGGGQGRLAAGKPGTFVFREKAHEPGARLVLGKRYAEGGIDQGLAVLRDLAVHPATTRHLSAKLARHFIADDVPPGVVERLSRTWIASDGDLLSVYRALLAEAAAWDSIRTKLKMPWEYLVSVYRGFDVVPTDNRALLAPFELLGQRLWSPGSPAGWPDGAAAWDGADALMKRIEWAHVAGERLRATIPPMEMAERLVGDSLSANTLAALTQAESGAQALTLLLLSPEFLRR